ncbi:MAG: hypothetical protein IJJ23_10770 [Clostridia bacterium]|nr:hypothetical protein [Clostridia bacterium]
MTVFIRVQRVGRGQIVSAPLSLEGVPATAGELICACVDACVHEQRVRVEAGYRPLTPEELAGCAKIGKIAFNFDYNGKKADLDSAKDTAMQAYRDGLFRVFLNGVELTDEDTPVHLSEGDELTFIRLVMLAGRLW